VCGAGATHVIAVPARNKAYVSNFQGASISIIDNATRTVVNTVTFPVGTTVSSFGGMALTQDGNFLLIAGRNVTAGEAGVFQLDLNTETLSYLGGILSASFARDCDVVPASLTGASTTNLVSWRAQTELIPPIQRHPPNRLNSYAILPPRTVVEIMPLLNL
jgi:DNA-binding beta-propeller fold protein YncE